MGTVFELSSELQRLADKEAISYSLPGNLPDQVTRERLEFKSANLLGLLSVEIDSIIYGLLLCRTAQELEKQRYQTFQKYHDLCAAASNVLRTVVPPYVLQDLIHASFEVLRKIIEDEGARLLGKERTQNLDFSLSTLQRAYRLCSQVATVSAPQEKRAEEVKVLGRFTVLSAWSLMHFDCLRLAIRRGLTLPIEIADVMVESCRASVMAYAAVRAAADLRPQIGEEPDLSAITLDAEDRELADESTEERESTLSGW